LKWTAVGIDAIISELDDCASFRHRRGFRDVVDAESADFPLAYNVLTHSNANQLVRLLRAIYRPHNVICVHVDAKVFSCSPTTNFASLSVLGIALKRLICLVFLVVSMIICVTEYAASDCF